MSERAPTVLNDPSAIPDLLSILRGREPASGRVLSVYLATTPERMANQVYLIALRDRLRARRAELPEKERARFDAAATQVERYLELEFTPHYPGVAIFASGKSSYFYAVPLPERCVDQLSWGEHPALEPLEEALDNSERVAVLLFDANRARAFTIFLGKIEESQSIEDVVPGRQKTGGWAALAQSRYARHRKDLLRKHTKHAIAILREMLHAHPFDRLFIAGPPDALSVLRHQLPRPLRDRLTGELHLEMFVSDGEVLAAARQAIDEGERQAELKAITELLESATTPHTALGVAATLDALNAGKVYALYVARSFAESGFACPTCGLLTINPLRCQECGEAAQPVANLSEPMIDAAFNQDATVDIVSGEAERLLLKHGGIGAWTRY